MVMTSTTMMKMMSTNERINNMNDGAAWHPMMIMTQVKPVMTTTIIHLTTRKRTQHELDRGWRNLFNIPPRGIYRTVGNLQLLITAAPPTRTENPNNFLYVCDWWLTTIEARINVSFFVDGHILAVMLFSWNKGEHRHISWSGVHRTNFTPESVITAFIHRTHMSSFYSLREFSSKGMFTFDMFSYLL